MIMMNRHRLTLKACLSFTLLIGATSASSAADIFWDGDPATPGIQKGSGTWNTTNNYWMTAPTSENNRTWANSTATDPHVAVFWSGATGSATDSVLTLGQNISANVDVWGAYSANVMVTDGGNANYTLRATKIKNSTASKRVVIDAAIIGDSVLIEGHGTVVFTKNNTYTGTTTFGIGSNTKAGTLIINGGFATAGGAITVGSGGTLGGIGTINRLVNVADGVLSAGDIDADGISTTGILTLTNNLFLSDESVVAYDLGTSSDLIAITGDLTLDGKLAVAAASGFGTGLYTLFTYTGTLTDNGLDLGSMPEDYQYELIFGDGTVGLNVFIPEPAQTVLIGGLISLVGIGLRFRRAFPRK